MADTAPMSSEVILQVAYYAMNLAGELLGEADLLFENGRYTRAVFLSIHAIEELGRSKLLLAFAKRATEGSRLLGPRSWRR